ncbi:mitochondrion heat shock 22 kDa protein [Tanacetum coccineum]
MTTEEGPECLDLGIPLVGVREECIKVSVDNNTDVVVGQGDKAFMQERGFEKYVCSIDVSDKVYKISDIKASIIKNTGLLQLAIPKLKPEDVTFDVKVDVLMKFDMLLRVVCDLENLVMLLASSCYVACFDYGFD